MDKLMPTLQWLAARFEEPSTWAGSGVIAVLLHSLLKNQVLVDSILAVCAAIGGLLAVVVPQPHKATVVNNVEIKDNTPVTLPHNSTITVKKG